MNLTNRFHFDSNPCRDTIRNHRSILVLAYAESLSNSKNRFEDTMNQIEILDLLASVNDHMEFQINVIDYHHYLSIDTNHLVTYKCNSNENNEVEHLISLPFTSFKKITRSFSRWCRLLKFLFEREKRFESCRCYIRYVFLLNFSRCVNRKLS